MRPRDRIRPVALASAERPSRQLIRAALVNPPDPSSSGSSRLVPPLGLGYVAAFAESAGFHVDLFDFALNLKPDAPFLRSTGLFDGYDVYGITSYTDGVDSAVGLASLVRAANPRALIVFGGYHVSILDRESLRDFSVIDVVVRGEGESQFARILQIVASGGRNFANVPSLTWRTTGGQIIKNEDDEFLADQDALPPPKISFRHGPPRYVNYFDWKMGVEKNSISMVSSRGCPKRCTFCSIVLLNPLWRSRSVGSMMDEISLRYAAAPFEHIFFQDANFFVRPSRSLEFARALSAFNRTITWSGTATPDHIVKHADVIAELGRLNCTSIEVGIESGNESSLARYGKGNNIDTNRQAIRILEDAGISVALDFIMFEPEMSLRDVLANFEFLSEFDLDAEWPSILFQELQLYPGTVARQKYLARRGECICEHAVPITRFSDPSVQAVFDFSVEFRKKFKLRIDDAIRELYRCLYPLIRADSGATELIAECQQGFATAIRLRHLPFSALKDCAENFAGHPDDEALARLGAIWDAQSSALLQECMVQSDRLHRLVQRAGLELNRKYFPSRVAAGS
jgi:radical SAM superfamily enzyme YgiQ (UPF0313 family)